MFFLPTRVKIDTVGWEEEKTVSRESKYEQGRSFFVKFLIFLFFCAIFVLFLEGRTFWCKL